MTTLVDTSALFAILDQDDPHHTRASGWFAGARDASERLVTHNYIALESAALVRGRLGGQAVSALFDSLLGSIRVLFVDEPLHRAAVAAHLARPAHPSLVDQVSFRFMRDRRIERAFAFDKDFEWAGFENRPLRDGNLGTDTAALHGKPALTSMDARFGRRGSRC